MATIISSYDLDHTPVSDYRLVRPSLASGDLLFASGNYTISQLIQQITGSIWSHCGIIFVVDSINRVLLLESVEDMGVRLVPLSKYFSDYDGNGSAYDGRVVLARSSFIDINTVIPIAQFGVDQLTRPFDFAKLAQILGRVVGGGPRLEPSNGYVCSELVAACFSKAGYIFSYNQQGFIAPKDIWLDNSVTMLGRIL